MTERKRLEDNSDARGLPLHLKYRPRVLADILGQDAVVKSLKHALQAKTRPHCYLFVGPAGTGKTSLARIVAEECDVDPMSIIEVDAASKNGVDDMRGLTENLMYQGFGDRPGKAILLNECQRLSAQAWDSLLTTTEEPPPHAYFMFTSTNAAKVPKAMVTRCQVYNLKPLRRDDVLDVLERVVEAERFDTRGKVLDMIADACGGSMRAALTMLATVHAVDDLQDVADLLQQPLEDSEIIELCRLLWNRKLRWDDVTGILNKMPDVQAETVRIIVSAYFTKALLGAKNDRDAEDMLRILQAFAEPFDPQTKLAPVLLAFGRIIFDKAYR
jgi:DNA polymerase III gamma/tau subunit